MEVGHKFAIGDRDLLFRITFYIVFFRLSNGFWWLFSRCRPNVQCSSFSAPFLRLARVVPILIPVPKHTLKLTRNCAVIQSTCVGPPRWGRCGVRKFLMSRPDENSCGENATERTAAAKKPYQEPSFRHERVFETMALACGKIDPTNFECRFHRNAS